MKKVLVTGASTNLGNSIINNLLETNKYEITAIDIKSKEAYQNLKKYKRKINILFGDLTDEVLLTSLVKESDYFINCYGINPPISNLKEDFMKAINYKTLENIVKIIDFFNPNCHLIYLSTTNIYDKSDKIVSNSSKILIRNEDLDSKYTYMGEELIKSKLVKYTIFRIPFILEDKTVYLYDQNRMIEVISLKDLSKAIVNSLSKSKDLNKKIKILSGGENFRIKTHDLLIKLLEVKGFTFNIIWNMLFNPVKYYGNIFKEDKKLDELLNYKSSNILEYFDDLKNSYNPNIIKRLLAKIYIKRLEKKEIK